MLRGEPVSSSELLRDVPEDVRQKLEKSSEALSRVIESMVDSHLSSGRDLDAASIADLIDKFIKGLESTGHASSVYSAPDLLKKSVDRAFESLSRKYGGADVSTIEKLNNVRNALDEVAENLRRYFNSREFAQKMIEAIDPMKLSSEEWDRLINEIMNMDLYNAGRGEGGGILDELVSKVVVSPRFRFLLKEYLREFRISPGVRESYHPIGKSIDFRRTFMDTTRTGIPLLVFKKPIVKPRTKEDIIFIYDVSGSMSSFFALITAVARVLSDLGLNVKVWYAEEGGMKAVSRDFIRELKRFGGGGTNLAKATREVLSREKVRDSVIILYSDLLEGADEEEFVNNMSSFKRRGGYPAVFVVECNNFNEGVRKALETSGIRVVCDVNNVKSFIKSLKELKHQLRKVSLIT